MKRSGSCLGLLFKLFVVLLLLCAFAGGSAYYLMNQPYQGFAQPVTIDFPMGTSTQFMAKQLQNAGVLHYWWEFMLVRLVYPTARLQAGEYQFSQAASPTAVFNRIVHGDVFFYEFTVPEGSNIFDISALVDHLGFLKGADFLKAARDGALIRDLAPNATTLEGFLFPSTYRITRRTTPQALCRIMTEQFRKEWAPLQDQGHPVAVYDVVTLASLVEKETAVPEERPIVASVYANRLQLGMQLDCDPTTIYAALLEGRYRGTIYRSDLDSSNPYNTYRHSGLPPGPIANPGLASLRAALAPATTDYLFFVAKADGSGGHNFSTTMAQHNRAVEQYRQTKKKSTGNPHS